MIRSLYTAATGMDAQQINMDVTANNLANVNTTGFKRSRADFQDLLYQTVRAAGSSQAQGVQVPTGIQIGLGTRMAATQKIFAQGGFQETNNPYDMVVEGEGFFQVKLPSGETAYTRDGHFTKSSDGHIVTSDGYLLDPPITVSADAIDLTIGEDGTVSAKTGGSSTSETIGQIELVRFPNQPGLESCGRNLYRSCPASGDPITGEPGKEGFGTIRQNMLEMSNVSVVQEMVNMILAQRAYEVNSKSITTSDEMMNIANNLRR